MRKKSICFVNILLFSVILLIESLSRALTIKLIEYAWFIQYSMSSSPLLMFRVNRAYK